MVQKLKCLKNAPEKTLSVVAKNSGKKTGPGCSKLTTSLVNVSLKFRMLISEICL